MIVGPKERNHHVSKRDCRCLWRILQKIYDDNEYDESEQEIGENENESSTDVYNSSTDEMTRIPEIMTEELQTAINKLKKRQIPRQQRNPSRRHQSVRWWDERDGETNL